MERRVWIPKPDGSERPLGIPTIRDWIVQMALKLVVEPIFEADFCEHSYGFRPQRSAHDAVKAVTDGLFQGKTQIIDADLSKYFETIPHAKLMAVVAERIADGGVLALIQQWLKAPVIEEDTRGKYRPSGGKGNRKGTPQGGVISPLLANLYLHLLDRIWERRVRWFTEERIRTQLRERHKVRTRWRGWQRFPHAHIHDHLGLFKLPATAGWRTAHASA